MSCLRLLIRASASLVVATAIGACDGDDDDASGSGAPVDPVDACVSYKNALIDKDFECYSSSGFYDNVTYWCAVTRGCDDGQAVSAATVHDCVSAIDGATCTEYAAASYDAALCELLWDELDCQPI